MEVDEGSGMHGGGFLLFPLCFFFFFVCLSDQRGEIPATGRVDGGYCNAEVTLPAKRTSVYLQLCVAPPPSCLSATCAVDNQAI